MKTDPPKLRLPELLIRHYQAQDLLAVVEIFYQTIHSVGLEHYTPAQVKAWAPLPPDYAGWQERLERWPPLVAEQHGQILGYITLTPEGHIEWTYTHKHYQRQGVAGQLYAVLEQRARAQGLCRLTVRASHFARGFFAQRGFHVLCEEAVARGGEQLQTWVMEKTLGPSP